MFLNFLLSFLLIYCYSVKRHTHSGTNSKKTNKSAQNSMLILAARFLPLQLLSTSLQSFQSTSHLMLCKMLLNLFLSPFYCYTLFTMAWSCFYVVQCALGKRIILIFCVLFRFLNHTELIQDIYKCQLFPIYSPCVSFANNKFYFLRVPSAFDSVVIFISKF